MNRGPGPGDGLSSKSVRGCAVPVPQHRRVAERLRVPEPSSSPANGAPRTQALFERAGFVRGADTDSVINGFPRVLMRLAQR
jgi:hypothetical protein